MCECVGASHDFHITMSDRHQISQSGGSSETVQNCSFAKADLVKVASPGPSFSLLWIYAQMMEKQIKASIELKQLQIRAGAESGGGEGRKAARICRSELCLRFLICFLSISLSMFTRGDDDDRLVLHAGDVRDGTL